MMLVHLVQREGQYDSKVAVCPFMDITPMKKFEYSVRSLLFIVVLTQDLQLDFWVLLLINSHG